MTDRPYCCPEPRCTPIHNHGDGESLAQVRPEVPFTCCGRMDREIEYSYGGVDHRNDLNRCVYTPLKGIIRFQENVEDWRLERQVLATALEELGEFLGDGVVEIARCPEHGLHGERDVCFVCGGPVERVAMAPVRKR